MNDNRNMILALVLSALVLLGWSFLSDRFFPTAAPQTQKVENGTVKPVEQPSAGPVVQTPPKIRARAQVLGETPRVQIRTPRLSGSINLKGARIDDLVLQRERQSIGADSPPVRLLSPAGAPDAYFASFGWSGEGAKLPGPDTVWTASAPVLEPGKPVTLTASNATGQRFAITIGVDQDYLFSVQQQVANGGTGAIAVRPYGLLSRADKSKDATSWTMHVGPLGFLGGSAEYGVDWDTLNGGKSKSVSSNGGWLGFTDKYWLTALAPAGNAPIAASFRGTPSGGYQADYAAAPQVVAPGATVTTKTRLFAGAKEKALLDRYEDAGIPKLSKSIDWGWFEWFMRPIADLLNWLFKVTGNFGVAIICLTFIVRLLMFPIAQKQFASMAAMRRVQPKIKAMQERFKNDKQKQQQEMLKLYQQEKINPAAGCLPILLQIPVFYALYKVLMVSVEMRHQPFALWIKDLSAPDPLTPVNLFGLLDFTPPHFLALGLLPILLGVTMWLQFKLNPQQMDPAQQAIFAWMPWIMMFVLAPFAAGLVLYWVTSNILTIAQQWWLYRRFGLHLSDTHPVKT
ncbi:membrane protein insertase YidC [Sphingomonas sinipercae]|uniref:Membrane protein insertase YidC n=1 Tax=Sphingomonas sinipercae TaxID=2714944 RepID=A0A6G7ZMF7_9SPHN|nr:membrane protein insertase YidC [Sphingomonas sinipercae]QIL02177.1 membrane protein insertase YidC [Sphingomonas sinipercae]